MIHWPEAMEVTSMDSWLTGRATRARPGSLPIRGWREHAAWPQLECWNAMAVDIWSQLGPRLKSRKLRDTPQ